MKYAFSPRRRIRGQGMTEYIIIVALIAIAAVGVYNLLGKTVRNQTAGIALGLAGQDAAAKTATGTNAKKAAVDASADANNAKSLESFADATGKK